MSALPPRTGPTALQAKLASLDLDKLEAEARATLKSGSVSKRSKAVHTLNAIAGLRRNNLTPDRLMLSRVPVLPPLFRPFGVVGDAFVPGDANELYQDLFRYRDVLRSTREELGEAGMPDARLAFYDAVRALYGYGEPVNPKTKARGVTGYLKQVTGTSPKYSFAQRKLFAKPQDSVSRGGIGIDPDLDIDEIGLPEEMAWKMYGPFIQGRLVRSGMSPMGALENIRDRTAQARKALELEAAERPVVYSRAPAWHKFKSLAGRPKLIGGNSVKINSYITTGMNADFDGDEMNVHLPATDDGVKEAWEKLLPSKMLVSIRDPERVMPVVKQEQILGVAAAQMTAPKRTLQFASRDEAAKAAEAGKIQPEDEVEFPE